MERKYFWDHKQESLVARLGEIRKIVPSTKDLNLVALHLEIQNTQNERKIRSVLKKEKRISLLVAGRRGQC